MINAPPSQLAILADGVSVLSFHSQISTHPDAAHHNFKVDALVFVLDVGSPAVSAHFLDRLLYDAHQWMQVNFSKCE